MSTRELKMVSIQISRKFTSIEDAQRILLNISDIHEKNASMFAKELLVFVKSKAVPSKQL